MTETSFERVQYEVDNLQGMDAKRQRHIPKFQ